MKYLVRFIIFLIFLFLGTIQVQAAPGINRKINFQGKVVNKGTMDGTNVSDGPYNFRFSLWTTLSAGTSIWTEVWNSGSTQVQVTDGIFGVALGTQATFPPTVDFNSDSLYVSVNFNSDGEMTPRIQMAAVPYAFNAEKVAGLTVTNTTGTLTIPGGKTISFGEAFSTTAVGITLDQNLSTLSSVNFAGLSIGSTTVTSTAKEINFLHNLATGNTGALFYANGVGITQLNIGTSGYYLMSQGTNPVWVSPSLGGGTTYSANNGLSMTTNVIGLGGTLTQANYTDIDIGTGSSGILFSSSSTGNQFLSITANGNVGIGKTGATARLAIVGVGTSTNITFQTHNSNGVDMFSIQDNGNVGIGKTGATARLAIVGVGTSTNYTFQTHDSNGVDKVTILDNGNVGIGTTNPRYLLHVEGTGVSGIVFIKNLQTGHTAPSLVIQNTSTSIGITGGEFIRFLNSSGVKVGRIRTNVLASSVAYSASGTADFAEYVVAGEPTEAGDLIAFSSNKYIKATSGEPLAGIHSSDPSFVGNESVSDQPNAFPLAMSGIVKLKVSSINGPISPGDPLTASPIRGVAVKAISPGSIGAKAIGAYNNADPNQVGMIDVIVNLSWYEPGLDITQQFNFDSLTMTVNDLNTSKIPLLVNGLEVLTKRIDGLEKNVSELNGQVAGLATSSAVLKTGFEDNPIIKFLVEFWNNVLFKGEVAFEKTPVFNNQTAGYAVVNIDDDQAEVIFENEYKQMPIVNVSLMTDDNKVGEVLGENYSYTVTNRTTKGFSIKLNKKAKTDLKFAWSVVLVQDAKTYQKSTPIPLPTIEPTIVPTETILLVTPTIEPTVEPTIFISPTATPGVGESGTIN